MSIEPAPDEAPYPSSGYAWYVLGVLTLAYTFSFVDRQVLNLLVGPIRRDLGLSDTGVSLLQGLAFAVFYTMMGIPLGRLADSRSRRGLIAIGIAVWSVMTALCGMARNFVQLFLARVGVGVGEAALSPAAYSLITDYFPPSRLARAASVYNLGVQVGSALALLVGGAVIAAVGDAPPVTVPILGPVRAWQLTFFIVGAPGLLLVALMATIREPARRGVRNRRGKPTVPIREVVGHLRSEWRVYGAHFAGFSLLSLVAYGVGAWAPTFMIRTYGWGAAEVGLVYGLLSLFFGTTGVFAGGWIADRLLARGRVDATLRTGMYGAIALVPIVIIAPLMPTDWLAIAMGAPLTFLFAFPFGVAAAAIQVLAPGAMRAQVTAVYLFFGTLIGLGAGPTVVALITDHVFGSDAALRYSMSVTGGLLVPIAVLFLRSGLGPFRKVVASR